MALADRLVELFLWFSEMEQVEHYGLGICSVFDGTITVDKLEAVFPSRKIQGDKRTVREDGNNEKNNRAVALLVLYSGKPGGFHDSNKAKVFTW